MKRRTQLWLAVLLLTLSACLIPRAQNSLRWRLWVTLNQLSRQPFGSRITDISWPLEIRRKYARVAMYHDANFKLPPYAPGRVVFLGDSLTERWTTAVPYEFFPGKGYIGRGISGQVTKQMVWRFRQDVIDLHPRAVVILAGTNDIAFGESIPDRTEKNLRNMAEMAQRHNIQPILCTIPPMSMNNPTHQLSTDREVDLLNAWLRQFAAQHHLALVDYYAALADPTGHMPPHLTTDGVHLTSAGYAIMRPLAQQAIDSLAATHK